MSGSLDIAQLIGGADTLTALFVDVVESTRLVHEDRDDFVRRWEGQVLGTARRELLPRLGGEFIKSSGDGALFAFDSPPQAIATGRALHALAHEVNARAPDHRQLHLRQGASCGAVTRTAVDLYGTEVNVAARLMSDIAGPGELIVTAAVRARLVEGVDGDLHDLGLVHLKHVPEPVHAYRVGAPGSAPVIAPGTGIELPMFPYVAVAPFEMKGASADDQVLGWVLTGQLREALSRSDEVQVASDDSTSQLAGRGLAPAETARLLKADYVLSGACYAAGGRLMVTARLDESRSGRQIQGWTLPAKGSDLLAHEDPVVGELIAGVSTAIVKREMTRARQLPLPSLEAYALLMGAVGLMHQGSPSEFERALAMLKELEHRARRHPIPHAYLANWETLRYTRGWNANQNLAAQLASEHAQRALDLDSSCALALTIDGFVHTNLRQRPDIGEQRYAEALAFDPNNALARLLNGTMHAFRGEGEPAVADTELAMKLSPLDPIRYFYLSLAATAALAARRYERAVELATQSRRMNRNHTSTLRALAIALSFSGRMDEARKTVQDILQVEPGLTATRYLERSPGRDYGVGAAWAEGLRSAGLPD